MTKKFEIRNSTEEVLIFQIEGKEDGVQVVYRDGSIWCTQKSIIDYNRDAPTTRFFFKKVQNNCFCR